MVVHDQQVLTDGVMTRETDPARHAWEFWARDVSELWSMPSSHTALAVVAAVCLWKLYPRLWPVVFGLAGLVGLCRVLFRAHYPSDVLIGAGIALAVTDLVWSAHGGVRLLDVVWKRAIDRNATPALPALMERERAVERGRA
jgi:membrane-associated phospholipid phosphatase